MMEKNAADLQARFSAVTCLFDIKPQCNYSDSIEMTAFPGWETSRSSSRKWSLRGADLWHLATAKSLQNELPELVLLTFDSSLERSAEGEGMACNADSH